MLGYERDNVEGILLSMGLLSEYREEENQQMEKQSKHPGSAKSTRRAHKLSKGKHMKNVPKTRK